MSLHQWVGRSFPSFEMADHDGELRTLDSLKGAWNVIFFYPKDGSPGCSVQARTFAKFEDEFRTLKANIYGVSNDSQTEHHRFKCATGGTYQFLTDEGGSLRKQLKLGTTLGLIPARVTFLLDPQGVIQWVYSNQFAVKRHVKKSLSILAVKASNR